MDETGPCLQMNLQTAFVQHSLLSVYAISRCTARLVKQRIRTPYLLKRLCPYRPKVDHSNICERSRVWQDSLCAIFCSTNFSFLRVHMIQQEIIFLAAEFAFTIQSFCLSFDRMYALPACAKFWRKCRKINVNTLIPLHPMLGRACRENFPLETALRPLLIKAISVLHFCCCACWITACSALAKSSWVRFSHSCFHFFLLTFQIIFIQICSNILFPLLSQQHQGLFQL